MGELEQARVLSSVKGSREVEEHENSVEAFRTSLGFLVRAV